VVNCQQGGSSAYENHRLLKTPLLGMPSSGSLTMRLKFASVASGSRSEVTNAVVASAERSIASVLDLMVEAWSTFASTWLEAACPFGKNSLRDFVSCIPHVECFVCIGMPYRRG